MDPTDPKWKPKLIRKRTVVSLPNNIVNNKKQLDFNTRLSKDLIKLNKQTNIETNQQCAKANLGPIVKNKPRSLIEPKNTKKGRLKRAKVVYKTKDPKPDSIYKLRSLHNTGAGRILVIIANGPSITELDLSLFKKVAGLDILTINKPVPKLWPTKYWAFFDTSQYRRHRNLVSSYSGFIFNSTAINCQTESAIQLKNIGDKGFSLDAVNGIHIGRSSVYASMQIANYMNYDEIYIFGCDMNPEGINGKLHFYGDNPDVDPAVRANRFKKEAEYYDWAGNNLEKSIRKKFYFCSSYNTWGFTEMFNHMDHKDAFSKLTQEHC